MFHAIAKGKFMFDHAHYVPVLKGKRAEFPAIGDLHAREGLTPFLEAVPTARAQYIPTQMATVWGAERPFFVDLLFFDEPEAGETHPVSLCFDAVAHGGLHAIPVTGLDRAPAYQEAVRAVVGQQARGYAIRLTPEDFEDEEDLVAAIDSLIDLIGIDREAIDVFVDGGNVHGMGAAVVTQMHRAKLAMLPTIGQWRTLTVIGGAFPTSLAPLTRGIWNQEPRPDWTAWHSLVTHHQAPPRLPAYGDYTIAHPDLPPTGRATILAQLRYTTPDAFLVWKGHNVFTHPQQYGQFKAICQSLIGRPEYRGPEFSWGDSEIYAKATNPDASSGNAETWRRIGVNHHIETVKDQIASLPAP